MVSRNSAREILHILTKYFVVFAVVLGLIATFGSAPTYAEEPPTGPVVPAACAVPAPEVDDAGIHITAIPSTNNPNIQWNWTFTAPATVEGEAPFAFDRYNYAIYSGDTLQAQGTLGIAELTLPYVAPADGAYSVYLWTVQGTDDPAYCSVSVASLDTLSPVIINDGYDVDTTAGVAVPLLSTDELGLLYSWSVDADDESVTIDDPVALNPTFTFTKDGTYTFTLTATDMHGNSSVVLLVITYEAPFVAPVTGPVVIPPEAVPPPVQTYEPLPTAAPVVKASPSVDTSNGKLPPEVDASIYASTTTGQEALNPTEKDVAGVVTAGQDGWKVFGISWYWWVLIVAIIGSAWLWVLRTYRSGLLQPDDI